MTYSRLRIMESAIFLLLFFCPSVLGNFIPSSPSVSKESGKSAMLTCAMEEKTSMENIYIHWYRQKPEGGSLEWILYFQLPESQKIAEQFDDRFSAQKEQRKNACFLTIINLQETDRATYYCAYWKRSGVKYFGTGTQLMITSRPTKKPSAKILPPSPAEVENNGEGTFLCILNGFFPYIIKVEWAEKGETSSSQLKMETGEIASNDFLVSWLTVSKADLWNKQFECQYWHESNSQSKGYKEKEITNPGIGKAGGPAEGERCPSDIVNSTNIAKSMVLNFSNNVAYITYILLLLKSTCYSSIIVFFIYKMKTASTSHDKA